MTQNYREERRRRELFGAYDTKQHEEVCMGQSLVPFSENKMDLRLVQKTFRWLVEMKQYSWKAVNFQFTKHASRCALVIQKSKEIAKQLRLVFLGDVMGDLSMGARRA